MRLVIIESPYAGEIAKNVAYARAAMWDCLERGEAPYASHLLYTQVGVLDDSNPAQRARGIEAGLQWGRHADASVVYTDLGISNGMQLGVERASREGRAVEFRSIPAWAAGRPVTEDTSVLEQAIDAKMKLAELDKTFRLRWAADMRAIARWQAEHGNTLIWPDHADLCVWLMEQLEAKNDKSA